MNLTREQIEGWKMNNGAMSVNEFRALCDLALSAPSAGTRIEPHKDCPWQNCLDSGRCRHPDDCDGAGWWKALDHSKLKIGEPCYRCGKVISAPLSHICEKPRAPRSASERT